jgi:hypothetical protein
VHLFAVGWFTSPSLFPPTHPPTHPLTHPCRSHPQLETSLDWLLAVYRFVFPFLVTSAPSPTPVHLPAALL